MEGKSWSSNPQFALRLAAKGEVTLTLGRPSKHWLPYVKDYYEAMHAIYVLHGESDGAPVRGVTRTAAKIVTQTAFVPFDEVSTTLKLSPLPDGSPYIVMPATFGPGMKGPFWLRIASDVDCELVELPPTAAQLKALEAKEAKEAAN